MSDELNDRGGMCIYLLRIKHNGYCTNDKTLSESSQLCPYKYFLRTFFVFYLSLSNAGVLLQYYAVDFIFWNDVFDKLSLTQITYCLLNLHVIYGI